ncbi:hypothetical protein Taro_046688 [Colocasia esculenta]|uniref:Uncharacterized protein n=1 Tax=Colocasia esculenta TaxID=4460 RepID=A0A843WT42_COLES|nr:hypothetical protein [Colocasia esculenta]
MESNKGYMAVGHTVTRPPFFDGTDYPYWQNRMQDEDTWTKDQISKGTLNWSALNMMQCAVHPKEYSRVSTSTSAKEMWDKLELIYEGTSEVNIHDSPLIHLHLTPGRHCSELQFKKSPKITKLAIFLKCLSTGTKGPVDSRRPDPNGKPKGPGCKLSFCGTNLSNHF